MIYGYIRVSTDKQSVSHQQFEITEYTQKQHIQVDKWINETISSRIPLNKRALGSLLKNLQEGDILIATEISRLGRSLMEVMSILQTCLSKNCQVWTIKENYKLGNDIQSQVLAFAFGLSAQIERNLISQRTKMSLDNMRAHGYKLGRPFGTQSKKLKLAANAQRIIHLRSQGISKTEIAKLFDVQPITVSRFLKRNGLT
ncbi:MAG: master DNA invertase Mpi family serine-type recombinase [Alphaproteobacteria bacterium]|nr:master DNA invertase Mpi family serine-type recombinase [Alphaproteobacteria bacterium]